jgi:hypothetical protein
MLGLSRSSVPFNAGIAACAERWSHPSKTELLRVYVHELFWNLVR